MMKTLVTLNILFFLALSVNAQIGAPPPTTNQEVQQGEQQEEQVQVTENYANGLFNREINTQRRVAEIPRPREMDVIKEDMVWRIIDLRETENQVLYYPTPDQKIEGRKSLIEVILDGVETQKFLAFDPGINNDDQFRNPMTWEEVRKQMGAGTSKQTVTDAATGEEKLVEVTNDINPNVVKQYQLKEVWYFDKRLSRYRVRIIGICPIGFFPSPTNPEELVPKQLFWLRYEDVTEEFARNEIYNRHNGAIRETFSDYFIKRKFYSYIIKASNMYNNRSLSTMFSKDRILYEAQKIERKLFEWEQNLWSY